MPVAKLVRAIRSHLPNVEPEKFDELSPGQQALWEASIYLEHHRLESAAAICKEAFGDVNTPGDSWVATLIAAIEIAQVIPGTDVQSFQTK